MRPNRSGYTFCLDAREVRPAQVCVVPVLQEDAVMESVPQNVELGAPVLVVQDKLRQEIGALAGDAARSPDPGGLRLLHGPVYGTKEQLWKRLLEFEEVARNELFHNDSWLLSLRLVAEVCRNKNESSWLFQNQNPVCCRN